MVRIVCRGGPLDGLECGLDTLERYALEFPIPLGSVWDDFARYNYFGPYGTYDKVTYERSLTLETDEKGQYIYNFRKPKENYASIRTQ